MRFVNAEYSWLAVTALCVLIGLLRWHRQRCRRRLERFVRPSVWPAVMGTGRRRGVNDALIGAGIVLALLAALRPQWGYQWEEIPRRGLDIMVVVDVSRSMLARDILPNRLARTKLALQELVQELRGDRIGLIAFAGTAFLHCPLTVDYGGFLLSVDHLSPELIPVGGTNIAAALEVARDGFSRAAEGVDKIMIVISDGEEHGPNPAGVLNSINNAGITVFAIGVGTEAGELILLTDEAGNTEYLKDNQGAVVQSRLNETLLADIALRTGGAYVKATPAQFGLRELYRRHIAVRPAAAGQEHSREKRYQERYQLFLALALLLLGGEFIKKERIRV